MPGRGRAPLWALLWPLAAALAGASSSVSPGVTLPLPLPVPTADGWTGSATAEPQPQSPTPTPPETPTQAQSEIGQRQTTEVHTETSTSNYTGLACASVLPPRRGSFSVDRGSGVAVGSVLAFWCRDGFQVVGPERITCGVPRGSAGPPRWSANPPVCEAIPRPEDRGLRVAVMASVVSGLVILAMSLSFITCCLQERRGREGRRDSRGRRREKSSRRSECWLEREEGEWEAFPPPRVFHLPQHLPPPPSADGPLYLGGMAGYENRGYHRSQESLLKAALPGVYRSESQTYPHLVLQRFPVPGAPSAPAAPLYLHLPAPVSSTGPQPHPMAPYLTSSAYPGLSPPGLSPDPQPPWH